jgi:hypothetical protein
MTDCDKELRSFDNFHDAKSLADRFFRWMEHYHPMREFWNKQNQLNIVQGSENYTYEHFREISMRRLEVMIGDLQQKKRKS